LNKSVWVVDDQQDILDVVQIVLESEGFSVKTFLDGSFVQEAPQNKPDVILLDILLSGEDGRELCRQLKSHQETSSIPVVLLSAHLNASTTFQQYGADGFLEKPFHLDDLIGAVRDQLEPDS
jgi:DNA-binding response OmpR family regulator